MYYIELYLAYKKINEHDKQRLFLFYFFYSLLSIINTQNNESKVHNCDAHTTGLRRSWALTPGLNTESQMIIEIRLITKKSWNKQCSIKFSIVLNSFKKSLGNCFCRARPGLSMQTGRNGPGPTLNSGRARPWGQRARPSESGPCRSLICSDWLLARHSTATTREYYSLIQRAQRWWETACGCRDEDLKLGSLGSEKSPPILGHFPQWTEMYADKRLTFP